MTTERADWTASHTLTADRSDLVGGRARRSVSVLLVNILFEQPHTLTQTHTHEHTRTQIKY